ERPARSIAAERAQGNALAGRMAAMRIRSAEQREPGDVLQQLVECVARRLLDLSRAHPNHRISALAPRLRQRPPGHDDRRARRWWREGLHHPPLAPSPTAERPSGSVLTSIRLLQ